MGEEQAPQAFKLSDRQHRIMSFKACGACSSPIAIPFVAADEQAPQAFKLSDRQHRIMSFIRMSLSERGYPPTMREKV